MTAERVALRRAAHQLLDHPRIFEDPVALPILGSDAVERIQAQRETLESPASRSLRAFLVARSRYAEDQLARAVDGGTRQYVVLGAGFDTFAYRSPYPKLRVFEVDYPATQSWKRQRLAEAGIAIPDSLTFAPVDFEQQSFADCLVQAGFDLQQPAFFSWLGVTPYLKPSTVIETLRGIAAMTKRHAVVFDYAGPRSSLAPLHRIAFDALADRVAAAGEPFQGFFEPEEMISSLRQMGFNEIEDLDSNAVNQLYFLNSHGDLRIAGALGHLVCAASSRP